ncbi:hypothetical protein E4T39_06268 [Aureobasidium subglaciale]|nr:hypothetical protein E4T39_06268 [Aureobasidium subglaciale]
MRSSIHALLILPLASHAATIVLSNDDGWAEMNLRTLYHTLRPRCTDVRSASRSVLRWCSERSASATRHTLPLLHLSCWKSRTRDLAKRPQYFLSMTVGIEKIINQTGLLPDLAISGINLENTLATSTGLSTGTIGAATTASLLNVPAVAFSGHSGYPTAWKSLTPLHSRIYSAVALQVANTLLASGTPYLPERTWLNVNFPNVEVGVCDGEGDGRFVLSRLYKSTGREDIGICGEELLPTEEKVIGTGGCYVSVSLGVADTLKDASAADREIVRQKLAGILTCLP